MNDSMSKNSVSWWAWKLSTSALALGLALSSPGAPGVVGAELAFDGVGEAAVGLADIHLDAIGSW
ncbi:MAG: hypothetical protein HY000_08380 [Planctomycetes bacterium]|nr:hypothetical protein [Planctomycetota bacterium]